MYFSNFKILLKRSSKIGITTFPELLIRLLYTYVRRIDLDARQKRSRQVEDRGEKI